MTKILIVASMLGRDGTSRFITYLANGISKKDDFHVNLLFFRKVDPFFLNKFDDKVSVESLNITGKIWTSFFTLFDRIIKKKPNICIIGFHQLVLMGFLTPLMNLFGVKLLIRDTIIPSLFHKNTCWIKRFLIKKSYSCFNKIIVQSKDMQNDLVCSWGVNKQDTILVNNPVDVSSINNTNYACPEELLNKDIFTFVAAGRLSYQKGYDIIINRMSELGNTIPFRLLVLGSGELEGKLKSLVVSKKLQDKVVFLGYKTNVAAYLKYADALLLSSRYEGFPNIVLEAQALGKPVFANNCLGGINEIIVEGENGLTCDFEDADKFLKGLHKFMNYTFSFENIVKMTTTRYDLDTIMERFTRIFKVI